MRVPLKCLENCLMLLRMRSCFFFLTGSVLWACLCGTRNQNCGLGNQVSWTINVLCKGLITYWKLYWHNFLCATSLIIGINTMCCIILSWSYHKQKEKAEICVGESVIVLCCHRKRAWLHSSSFHISPGAQFEFICCIRAQIPKPTPPSCHHKHTYTHTHMPVASRGLWSGQ